MSIGLGIAIAGVWVFAGMTAMAKQVTATGFLLSIVIAGITTAVLLP